MFTCMWQLWDWLETPPLFTSAMDSKKLQQLQQANSHLAPQKKLPLGYHQNLDDYNDVALAQAYNNSYAAQYHQNMRGVNFNALNFVGSSPYTEQSPSSSGGFGTSSNTLSPQENHEYLMRLSNTNLNPFLQQAQYPTNDQLYQTPRDIRPYQLKGQQMNVMGQCTSPVTALQDQYQQLQKARIQAQMKTQNDAVAQQQRTFALRQALNPPVPVNLSASPSMLSNIQMQSQGQPIVQAPLRNVPPSTLNLNNQYQPAFNNSPINKQNYQQYQQSNGINSNYNNSSAAECNDVHHGIKDPSPVYIQQNHPEHVVNQACQTQFTANQQQQQQFQHKQSPLHSEDSLSSPSKNNSSISERRKSTGSSQTIKSPISKRPLSAPVTLSGWLYKQGSDGLKVWRKRWFVLAEYCLYYYKGPEEEKVLGSLTLPSYKISPCSPDDKIYRKFAFKCEHTNMRTYWLAAENQEQMSQWMRGLIAAAMMHNNELVSQSNEKLKYEKFKEINKSSTVAMPQQQIYKDTAENSGFSQPLYANAPPKPRRITEGGYSSPSPEHSNENSRSDQARFSQGFVTSPNLQPARQHRSHHAIYNTKTGNVISSLIPSQTLINNNVSPQQINEMNLRAIQNIKLTSDEIYSDRDKNLEIPYLNAERRTPDAYGRSKHNKFFASDYEDINLLNPNEQYQTYPGHVASYTRPISPRRYNQQLIESQALAMQQSNVPYPRTKSQQSITRPRSADFLEYDSGIKPDRNVSHKTEMIRAPRPKSSLDINRSQDNYHYSEASYAEKMRRSALYLQKNPNTIKQKNINLGSNTYSENQYEKQKYYNEIALQQTNNKYYNEDDSRNFIDMQQNETFLRSASARLPKKHNSEFNGDDAIIDGERKREESMKRLLEWKQRMLQSPLTRKGIQQNGSQSYLRLGSNPNFQIPNHEMQKSRSQVNNTIGYSSYSSDDEDGNEQMPAGRSSSPSTNNATSNTILLKAINNNITNKNNKEFNEMLKENLSYVPVYETKALSSKIMNSKNFETLLVKSKNQAIEKIENNLEKSIKTDESKQISVEANNNRIEIDMEAISNFPVISPFEKNEAIPGVIDQTIEFQNNDKYDFAQQKNESNDEQNYDDCLYTDDDLNEALEEEINKSEIEDNLNEMNIIKDLEILNNSNEDHYLPMTPKKPIHNLANSLPILNSISDDEENPYVEMTKTLEIDFCNKVSSYESHETKNFSLINHQHYHSEPVYTELPQKLDYTNTQKQLISQLTDLDKKESSKSKKKTMRSQFDRNKRTKDLPDILKPSESVKTKLNSNTSDEDDELSINRGNSSSQKLRSKSRFSLSDTFRPASYYLGASTNLTNSFESSDSEIVSPPSIPSSSPSNDIQYPTEDIFSSEDYNTIKRKDKFNLSLEHLPKHSNSVSSMFNKIEPHTSSRLSLPEQFLKFRNQNLNYNNQNLSDSNYSFQTDATSITSSDLDFYNKLKMKSPTFCEEITDRNKSFGFTEKDSAEISVKCDFEHQQKPEINMVEEFQEEPSINLDSYLNELTTSKYDSHNLIENKNALTTLIKPPKIFRSSSDEHFYGSMHFASSTDSLQKLDSKNYDNEVRRENECGITPTTSNLTDIRSSYKTISNQKALTIPNNNLVEHARENDFKPDSNLSVHNLLLNNQRDINLFHKNRGINHIHNVISNNSNICEKLAYNMPKPNPDKNISKALINKNFKSPLIGNITSGLNLSSNVYSNQSINHPSHEILNSNNNSSNQSSLIPNPSYQILSSSQNNELNSGYRDLSSKLYFNNHNNTPATALNQKLNISETTNSIPCSSTLVSNSHVSINNVAGEQLWDEDNLWRESLRKVSQKHARSLDNLDSISPISSSHHSKLKLNYDAMQKSSDSLFQKVPKTIEQNFSKDGDINENDVYIQLAVGEDSYDTYEVLREDTSSNYSRKSVEIDREIIRQWDSMSSGLMKNNPASRNSSYLNRNNSNNSNSSKTNIYKTSVAVQDIHNLPNNNLIVKPESLNLIDQFYGNDVEQKYSTIPKTVYNRNNDDLTRSYTNLNNYIGSDGGYLNNRATIDLLERETSSQIKNMDVSAGDLLSRTHEELILLLIQLRRQNSKTARAIEQCCTDIHKIQNRIRLIDGLTREEKIQRLDQLKQHLLDLEKQYEKSKPLVNLVDNMVKLGSLYRNNETNKSNYSIKNNVDEENINSNFVLNDRHEFNKKIEEDRLVKEEKKQWDRLSPNHYELQSKVDELYKLDQMLQEESGTLQNLQKDKEEIEKALTGIRSRLQGSDGPLLAVEAAKKQQQLLEQELSRVHKLLAQNSKKLEQTVAGNSILEQELIVLRQKLQTSQPEPRSRPSPSVTTTSGYTKVSSTTTANLEAELKRVQKLVGDMQRQRKELSHTVKQLTENSNRLYQDINRDYSLITSSTYGKKRTHSSSWTETDLDSMKTLDQTVDEHLDTTLPLYVDTASTSENYMDHSDRLNGSNYDDDSEDGVNYSDTNPFINALNNEKQEIKTVRIVKRESERRHRDRERTTNNNSFTNKQNLGQVIEENSKTNKDLDLIYTNNINTEGNDRKPRSRSNSVNQRTENSNGRRYSDYSNDNSYSVSHSDKNSNIFSNYGFNENYGKSVKFSTTTNNENIDLNNLKGLKRQTDSMQSLNKSISELTPVFHSEVARQIMNEMSAGSASEDNTTTVEKIQARNQQHKHKRITPREKRRHNTAPHNVNQLAMEKIHSANEANKNNSNFRARDDLDMEVALRPRINAPDVVRSALGQNEKISENTIDRLFGAPSKILIPERYIPEKAPELSPTEKKRRQEKVEAIKKMLAENPDPTNQVSNATAEEKKQREHLLQLNQILAQQVMQMSKIVAERAMAALPSEIAKLNLEMAEDREFSSSPIDSLPQYQQRQNFYT